MKTQITRLSPHQNGKVFAVLMAASVLIFIVPFMVIAMAFGPADQSPPWVFILLMPVFYLIIGYLMVAVSCWIYNTLVKVTGGIEFESATTPE
jgi:ABC-type thiamin/hydroxymethylpyrimidine transport system permease subunit